ncbi:TetR/AcrR family transcriptional regulator [Streptosporangium sp. NBC_01639]|uniref:TetR/AcrR family transcriptional regulator n=1 Tax=Streptosporangium sp. NBC_01639 TaxID=2975948 RepID=UPI00386D66C3
MPPASPPHRLRADAARNRRSLLDAAREVFAEHGMEASVAEIAQRAGIGKGTVFRHFATKECLAAAIVSDRLDELAATGRTLLDATDPGAALLEFMTAGVELQARDRAFCQAATTSVRRDPAVRAASDRLSQAAESLTEQARRQGAVRDDITGQDVILLLGAACQAAAPLGDTAADLWRRYLYLIFDGMRPEGAHPLPRPAPARARFDQAVDPSGPDQEPSAERC